MTTELDPELRGWLLDYIKEQCEKPWGTGPQEGGPVSLDVIAREFFDGDQKTVRAYVRDLKNCGLIVSVGANYWETVGPDEPPSRATAPKAPDRSVTLSEGERLVNQPASAKPCNYGHERTPENVYTYPNGKRSRCRACQRERNDLSLRAKRPKRVLKKDAYRALLNGEVHVLSREEIEEQYGTSVKSLLASLRVLARGEGFAFSALRDLEQGTVKLCGGPPPLKWRVAWRGRSGQMRAGKMPEAWRSPRRSTST